MQNKFDFLNKQNLIDNSKAFEYWKKIGFELLFTADGSPTLRSFPQAQQGENSEEETLVQIQREPETMHHRGGAYSETQLVYGEALRWLLKTSSEKNFSNVYSGLSIGLGLGYNELLWADECLKNGIAAKETFFTSFESEDILKHNFLEFLKKESDPSGVYQQILKFFFERRVLNDSISEGKSSTISKITWKDYIQEVREFLSDMESDQRWILKGTLSSQAEFHQQFNIIFYDAFSSKTSPELWEETFLNRFFKETTSNDICIVSTYACTGALKRALKNNLFNVEIKEGFLSKRDRTWATR